MPSFCTEKRLNTKLGKVICLITYSPINYCCSFSFWKGQENGCCGNLEFTANFSEQEHFHIFQYTV